MEVRIRTPVTSALVALAPCLFSLVQSISAVNDRKKVEESYKSLFRWRKFEVSKWGGSQFVSD